jgi:hypothetical protein
VFFNVGVKYNKKTSQLLALHIKQYQRTFLTSAVMHWFNFKL